MLYEVITKTLQKQLNYTLHGYYSQYFRCVMAHFLTQILRYDSTQNHIKTGFGKETLPR